MKVALTIAGSDSSGGAGIQADLKTFTAFGVYGASVITALTAQNTVSVRSVAELEPGFVAAQIDAVMDDLPVAAAKTEMLARESLIEAVAERVLERVIANLVVDPVIVAASRLRVKDFHQDGEQATLTINEKGNKHRTIGVHFAAAEAISEYIRKAGLEAGPLFRARRAPHSQELGEKPMNEASMYRVIAPAMWKSCRGRSRKASGSTAPIHCGRPPHPPP